MSLSSQIFLHALPIGNKIKNLHQESWLATVLKLGYLILCWTLINIANPKAK